MARRFDRVRLLTSLVVVGALLIAVIAARELIIERRVTVRSLSPDSKWAVELQEKGRWSIDRNFLVRLVNRETRASTVIFESPDEGRPIGTEHFLWSVDGASLLLVGRHFYAKPELRLGNGDIAYLLCDTQTGRVWCNASQRPDLERFDRSLLEERGLDFSVTCHEQARPATQ